MSSDGTIELLCLCGLGGGHRLVWLRGATGGCSSPLGSTPVSPYIPIAKVTAMVMVLVASELVTNDHQTVSNAVVEAGSFYAADLPNLSSLKSEVHNWYSVGARIWDQNGTMRVNL